MFRSPRLAPGKAQTNRDVEEENRSMIDRAPDLIQIPAGSIWNRAE